MKQHIDSFDYFINTDIKKIVAAQSNCTIRSDVDPKFFLRYTDIYVGEPSIDEDAYVVNEGKVGKLRKGEWVLLCAFLFFVFCSCFALCFDCIVLF